MKLAIIGATGGIGRHLVEQALTAGHFVTAVARDPRGLPGGVTSVAADLSAPDVSVLASAMEGADAVLSGLGPRSNADAGIASRGTQAIIRAMEAAGAKRLEVVSAAPVSTVPSLHRPNPPRHDPGEGFFMRHVLSPAVKRVFRAHYVDLARMEDLLVDSSLNWTVVRPPRLTNGPTRERYRTARGQNLRRGLLISRGDVAHFMLKVVTDTETFGESLGIAY